MRLVSSGIPHVTPKEAVLPLLSTSIATAVSENLKNTTGIGDAEYYDLGEIKAATDSAYPVSGDSDYTVALRKLVLISISLVASKIPSDLFIKKGSSNYLVTNLDGFRRTFVLSDKRFLRYKYKRKKTRTRDRSKNKEFIIVAAESATAFDKTNPNYNSITGHLFLLDIAVKPVAISRPAVVPRRPRSSESSLSDIVRKVNPLINESKSTTNYNAKWKSSFSLISWYHFAAQNSSSKVDSRFHSYFAKRLPRKRFRRGTVADYPKNSSISEIFRAVDATDISKFDTTTTVTTTVQAHVVLANNRSEDQMTIHEQSMETGKYYFPSVFELDTFSLYASVYNNVRINDRFNGSERTTLTISIKNPEIY